MTPEEEARLKQVRKGRNVAMALALLGLVLLFYAITFVQFGT